MKPLSIELRQRIVEALDTEASQHDIARRFAVSISTVERLSAKKRAGTSLHPLPTPGRKPRVTEEQLPKFEELVRSKNDWTAQALSDAWQQQGGNTLSMALLHNGLASSFLR